MLDCVIHVEGLLHDFQKAGKSMSYSKVYFCAFWKLSNIPNARIMQS